ncbi:iron-siderophore ABC transporter substrate-binding protein [Actinotignum sanguinis]|uniref:Iron-siderophore ABC transporter substrate-binding protein n=2 Tax=Actinomycetaceae TaxID=2049 RepID=A0ABZ0REN9_9ACTO|nr:MULTISPECIES: iron-siderophore ABC transporter substrate-binding protein [Actinotignum]WPJ89262.1 iron-siderophore ABC transporter substrate-binding protein [Schaalia turicensis]MDE1552864.1 iron-siderophore ABC transporter substrate-binding protein [Actinotignum sanguinis]MDE1565563.1 iron-siderophore ABC transporter substrate-binding protein [Actinotignum sanguinis]MDE1577333.1 iron-siderophore ABC transporter substrate-binding protein [Actinotignum sanguinis]MDE1642868.1 iron-siderophore
MKKSLTAWAGTVLVACLAFAGCGSQKSNDSANSSASPASSSAAASSATDGNAATEALFPATIDTKFGPVTVKEAPQRVVALGWGDAEVALSLGVQPVGAADWLAFGGNGVGPWVSESYEKAPEILGTMELSYEKIAALKPDLILDVKTSGDKERHDKLSQIAPTVSLPEGADNWLTSTKDQVTMIGAALGKPKAAAAQLDAVEKKFAEVTAAHPDWKGKSVTVATKTSEGWGAYLKGDTRLEFMTKLGFVQNPKVQELAPADGGFAVQLSAEQLDAIDADLIAAFPIFIDTAQITEDATWQKVPAVAAGHAFVVDGDLSNAFSLGTPAAQLWALDKLTPLIEKAAK